MKNKKFLVMAVSVALALFLLLIFVENIAYQYVLEEKKEALILDYQQIEQEINQLINNNNNIIRGLAAYLETTDNMNNNMIETFLSIIFNETNHNVQAINVYDDADDIITFPVPEDKDINEMSLQAQLYIDKDFIDDKEALTLYMPYLDDGVYGGHVKAVIDASTLFKSLDDFVKKHKVQLSITSNIQEIYGTRFEYAPNNMTYDINTPITDWHVHVQSLSGWMSFNYWFILLPFIALMFSALVGFKIYQLGDDKRKGAYYDSLTGLYNRFYLYHYSEKFLNVGKLNHYNIGVILVDIDDFQKINDDFGHLVGDGILKVFADNLKEQMSSNQKCFRVGGDEFAIILENVVSKDAMNQIIDNLHQSLKEAFVLYEDFVTISFASGVALYPEDGDNLDTLFQHAHRDMSEI